MVAVDDPSLGGSGEEVQGSGLTIRGRLEVGSQLVRPPCMLVMTFND